MAEFVVHPRRPSARHRRGDDPRRAREIAGHNRFWAHGTLEPARATAARWGWCRSASSFRCGARSTTSPRRTCPTACASAPTPGPTDDAELLRVNNAAFSRHPEQGGWTDADLAERRAEPWFDPDGLFLAFDDTPRAAWLPLDEGARRQAGLGEVYVVGVDPAAQGRGLGGMLTPVGLA